MTTTQPGARSPQNLPGTEEEQLWPLGRATDQGQSTPGWQPPAGLHSVPALGQGRAGWVMGQTSADGEGLPPREGTYTLPPLLETQW